MSKPFFIHDDFDSNVEYFETEKEALKYFERIKINLTENGGWPQEVLDGAIKFGVVICDSRAASRMSVPIDPYGDPIEVELADIENPLMKMLEQLETENETLKDRLLHEFKEVKLIGDAAKDEINKLEAENKRLIETITKLEPYLPWNGDTWVQDIARHALAEVKKGGAYDIITKAD